MRKKLLKSLKRIAAIFLVAWLGLVVLAALFYPRLLYHPDRRRSDVTPVMAGAVSYEQAWLVAGDGVRLDAWFVPAPPETRREMTLLVFHGNAGNLGTAAPRLALYSRLGYDCFMVDYHGFGASGGAPSEKNLFLDAEAAWRYLTEERGLEPGEIVILGYSLGGAVASWLAERHPDAAGLVLESTFTSLAAVARDFFPYLPCRLIVGDAYNTLGRLPNIAMPILVAHGRGDQLVAFWHGEAIHAAIPGPRDFLVIGNDHNVGFLASGRNYEEGVSGFIEKLRQN